MEILNTINSPEDIKALDYGQLDALSSDVRSFLIENVAKTGGHLASNLGVVELTIALHRVYDTANDRLVFDVGHQAYVHKIITGRREAFSSLRTLGGLSGFPKPSESIHDAAVSGHASNAVSAALGMARARTLLKEDKSIAVLLGDGALTGGLAYEGLSDAGASGEPMVVILNDNGMSIEENVGGVSNMLSRLRVRPKYLRFKRWYRRVIGKLPPLYNFTHRIKEWLKNKLLPHNMFYDMGFQYLGPVDGHDIKHLEAVISWARELNSPVIVHALTQKGKGYTYAEDHPSEYHGVGSFDAESGVSATGEQSFSAVFGEELLKLASEDERITAITASMCSGTGLSDFAVKYPERFFDVGIAEGHAATMASGMARSGLTPVFAVYSSFLQRAYDMLIHDIALSRLHVVLAVDRAGIVGPDGETHQGSFDLSFLSSVPHMAIMCPSNYEELREMLYAAIYRIKGPVAVRYPRGGQGAMTQSAGIAPCVELCEGRDITLISYGILINNVLEAAEALSKNGISAEVIKLNLVNPLDYETILKSIRKTRLFIIAEDVCENGCAGTRILAACSEAGIALRGSRLLNLGNGIVKQGTTAQLMAMNGLDAYSICSEAARLLEAARENPA